MKQKHIFTAVALMTPLSALLFPERLYGFLELYSFPAAPLNPATALVQGSDGNFYGTTQYGGTNGDGAVFRMTTNGTCSALASLNYYLTGANPLAGLVQGRDGDLYGTTEYGGPAGGGSGTVFKISTNGALTVLYEFFGGRFGSGGGYPDAGLVQGADGNFYGTTSGETEGIDNGFPGTAFEISTNGMLNTLCDFTGGIPVSGLVQGRDGSFYGTTTAGIVFRLSIVPSAPLIQPVTLGNSAVSLTWSTEAGGTYQLQYTSDLSSPNWTNLGSTFSGNGETLTTTDSITNGPQRFYRLALSR